MSQPKYRLVTRSDFDGLVCAVLLNEMAWSYRSIGAKVWMLDLGRSFDQMAAALQRSDDEGAHSSRTRPVRARNTSSSDARRVSSVTASMPRSARAARVASPSSV